MLPYHEVSLQTVHHEDAAVAKSLLSKKLAIVSHYVTYVFGVMIDPLLPLKAGGTSLGDESGVMMPTASKGTVVR